MVVLGGRLFLICCWGTGKTREGAKPGAFGKVSKMVVDASAAHQRAASHLAADAEGEDLRGALARAEVHLRICI